MKKRIISLLICVVMVCSLLPLDAFAFIGAVRTTQAERDAVTTSEITSGGVQYLVLQNDYITFAVQKSGSGSSLRSYTIPTSQLGSNNDIFSFPAETNKYYLGDQEGFSNARQLQISSISGSSGSDDEGKILTLNITFTDSRLVASMRFWLERMNNGENSGTTEQQVFRKDLSEAGNHWAVVSYTTFSMTASNTGPVQSVGYPTFVKEYPLYAMGHKNASITAPILLGVAEEHWLDWKYQDTTLYSKNISGGLGYSATYTLTEYEVPVDGVSWTRDKNITTNYTEAYTENYLAANPFVGLSSFNYDAIDSFAPNGVEGHYWGLPEYVSSDGKNVTTYAPGELLQTVDAQENQTVYNLWGFRDLYAEGDAEAPTQPDNVTVPNNADRLAVYYEGGGFNVRPVQGAAAVTGDPVAVIRGTFKIENGEYVFAGNAAALSPSVTATWGSDGYLRITPDGRISHSGLSLSAPSFKFYAPNGEGSLTLGFSSEGLTMEFDTDKNDAIFSLDIPHATALVTNGYADTDGNLRFTGTVGISTLFDGAAFTMEELGYGLKNGRFTVNGVKASGSFDTAKLIGLDLAEVEGSINTFAGQESYAFDVELDLFSMAKVEAELELKRLRSNGALIPDDLYFYVQSGVPLAVVPAVPVAQITGGGMGFYNLADTINGDYSAVPPITIRGSVKGKFVQLLSGSADTVIGPGTYEFEASSIGITGMESWKIIDSASLGLYIGGETVTYGGVPYSGMSFTGKANLKAGLPTASNNWLKINGGAALSLFGGLDSENKNLFVRASGNSHINAELQFPDSWEIIGGMNLLGVGADVVVGGHTVIPVSGNFGNSFTGAFSNMKLYLGVMGQASLLGCNARVWVILPQSAATRDWWGYEFKVWKGLSGWSWDGRIQGYNLASSGSSSTNGVTLLANQPALLTNNTTGSTTQTVNVNVTNEDDSAYMVLAFDENTVQSDIQSNLKVAGPNGDVTLTWLATDAEGNITNADAANVMSSVVPRSDGTGNDHVVIIYLGQGTSYNGNYTITTDASAGQSQTEADEAANVQLAARTLSANSGLTFTAEPYAINVQPDELGVVTFKDNTVTGSVKNPESGVTYVLRTYLSETEGGADYLVDEQMLNSDTFSVPVPTTGTAAPSGDYYITTFLMRQEKDDYDGDGAIEDDEIALLNIGSASSTGTISYTNDTAPAAPSGVELTAIGNEIMTASWNAVTGADGYKVVIYNADGTETGLGYEYDASQFSEMPGLSYDKDTGTYSIDMAMTAGVAASDKETPITLEANKSYKVGVMAYKSESVGEQSANYYSTEAQSAAALLPEYTPLELEIYVAGKLIEPDPVTGIYNASAPSNEFIQIYSNEGSASYSITRTDEEHIGEALTGYGSTYDIPEFEGNLMLQVTGSVTNNGVTDTTTGYLLLTLDDTAPILTLDEETFYADPDTREFTISGVTEPGASIIAVYTVPPNEDNWFGETVKLEGQAAEDGSFSLSGTLPDGLEGIILPVSVMDEAGNETKDSALVNLGSNTPEPEPEPDPEPDTGDGGGGPTYAVELPAKTANGSVSVSPRSASQGSTVTITVKPDEGYELNTLKVTDSSGKVVALTDKGDGKYTFKMPGSRVKIAATFREAGAELPFTDVPSGAWYAEGVGYAYEHGLMNGISDTTFAPDLTTSRAMIATILWRLEGSPKVNYTEKFDDVASGAWYYDAIRWAAKEGIVTGYGDGTFGPDDPITREQMAAMLYRYAQYKKYDVSVGESTNILSYTDFDKLGEWAISAMQWACGSGVINGTSTTTLSPRGSTTRAQAAVMLMRFCEEYVTW